MLQFSILWNWTWSNHKFSTVGIILLWWHWITLRDTMTYYTLLEKHTVHVLRPVVPLEMYCWVSSSVINPPQGWQKNNSVSVACKRKKSVNHMTWGISRKLVAKKPRHIIWEFTPYTICRVIYEDDLGWF